MSKKYIPFNILPFSTEIQIEVGDDDQVGQMDKQEDQGMEVPFDVYQAMTAETVEQYGLGSYKCALKKTGGEAVQSYLVVNYAQEADRFEINQKVRKSEIEEEDE